MHLLLKRFAENEAEFWTQCKVAKCFLTKWDWEDNFISLLARKYLMPENASQKVMGSNPSADKVAGLKYLNL